MTSQTPGPAALAEAQAQFAAAGLPFPPIPAAFRGRFRRISEWLFGTREDERTPTGPMWFLEEAVTRAAPDYVLLGHGGYGAASQAMHYYLVQRPLAVFIQIGWRNVYGDDRETARQLAVAFADIEELIAAAADATANGVLHEAHTVAVSRSDFEEGMWYWFDKRASRDDRLQAPWHQDGDAIRAATAALRAATPAAAGPQSATEGDR
jgi:hypothetical protein